MRVRPMLAGAGHESFWAPGQGAAARWCSLWRPGTTGESRRAGPAPDAGRLWARLEASRLPAIFVSERNLLLLRLLFYGSSSQQERRRAFGFGSPALH